MTKLQCMRSVIQLYNRIMAHNSISDKLFRILLYTTLDRVRLGRYHNK